jgi:acetolactate synthase-1/3 small subunit
VGDPGTKEQLLSLEDLEAVSGLRTGRKHVLSILVENKPGVLTRVAGLFARRGFNIETLTVGPTDDAQISRITLTVDGALHPIDQVTKQLHKLIEVLKIRDLEPAETVTRELALFKVSVDGPQRGELMQFCEIFRGRVVDITKRSMILEITGTTDKIEAFERMVRPYGLIEMMRTGEIARLWLDAAQIAHVATPVVAGVGVEDFSPMPVPRQTEPVAGTRYGGEIGDKDQRALAVLRRAGEGDHVRVRVVGLDPPEARWV